MKLPLLMACLMGLGLFALSATSRAASRESAFHIRAVPSGFAGHAFGMELHRRSFLGGRSRIPMFHRMRRHFFTVYNPFTPGFFTWYPIDYGWYPDDYSSIDDEPSYGEPGYNYQYWNEAAVPAQSEPAQRANNNGPTEVVINLVTPAPAGSHNGSNSYGSSGAEREDTNVMRQQNEPTVTGTDPAKRVTPIAPPAAPNPRGGAFDNLVLVSWLNDGGKYVIFVQNTETNDVQKITSEPNNDGFRIVEIRPNTDAKLFEVVISDGNVQGAVRFHFAAPAVAKTLAN